MTTITCLGGFREVGNSSVLVDFGKKFLFDSGVVVETGVPPLSFKGKASGLFLTHGHLDHVGTAPIIHRQNKCPIYATPPVFDQAELLLKDSLKIAKFEHRQVGYDKNDIAALRKGAAKVKYGDVIKLAPKVNLEVYDAGHMAGSAMGILDIQGYRILYTGDFNTIDTELVKGMNWNDLGKVDTMLVETTYSTREHAPRQATEKKFVNKVNEVVGRGGTCVIPSFSYRASELVMILDKYGIDAPVYMDGMAKAMAQIYLKHPQFLRDPLALESAMSNTTLIRTDKDRSDALKEPAAIVTTSGVLDGGPVVYYIKRLYSNPNNALLFTGFQIPRTSGRYLMDTGRYILDGMDLSIKMERQYYDFSSHAGRSQLIQFVKRLQPERVICMHGDYAQQFATELQSRFDLSAIAPMNGAVLKV